MKGLYVWLPLLLALCRCTSALRSSLQCTGITGRVSQIDAGRGQVFGVNSFNVTFTVAGDGLLKYPGGVSAVSPGPYGIFAVMSNNKVARWLDGEWVEIGGDLTQIDAGGSHSVAGILGDTVRCLPESVLIRAPDNNPVVWHSIEGTMKHISCGLHGCWGVDKTGHAYFRHGITKESCVGERWTEEGKGFAKVEAGTDEGVYALSNDQRQIYRRLGISKQNPAGTSWAEVKHSLRNIRDMTYDMGTVWIVAADDYSISKCKLSEEDNVEE